mmetsp:Transcript_7476/g.13009  ORF Transcript_7476/g.13009 Transcript_7476/m.13009 type:complete len:249 (-) Transcript_7476:265-1011(-)|eukprot:CAMPEP_0184557708 /NCGR_PEP_ID=MMETSP0199_2-20130426/43440_1 /TAXON_ID=1112570 /ORGANISM="Thraustochytrium sp., Strain LLF1b" /LENGTH=248 /DNA_ID=CAMNT_0026954687 /DNA_START=21 /DNA_END=767 /DNA_ORIENTATION=-
MSLVALVTGGRGIGRATAIRLAANAQVGAVAILSHTEASATESARQAVQAAPAGDGAVESFGISCDVGDPVAVGKALDEIKRKVGVPDLVVNGAGVTNDGLIVRAKDERLMNTFACNLLGPTYVCRGVIKELLRAKKPGAIVNVGSVVGLQGGAGQSAYSASKAGLVGLTKSLAKEVGAKGIRVNMVEPGYINTDMTQNLDHSKLAATIPLGRLGDPDEVAALIEFLLLHKGASYMTGSVLRIDGGLV